MNVNDDVLLEDYRQAILRTSAMREGSLQELSDAINRELAVRRQVLTRMQK